MTTRTQPPGRNGDSRSRGAAQLLDDIARDVRYAFRSLRRAPSTAATIVLTVAVGLGLVAVVFTILSSMVFRVDEVRNPHELFAVQRQQSEIQQPAPFTREDFDDLVRETDVFSDTFATTPDVRAWIEGVRREGRLVTGNFFRMLGAAPAQGRVFLPDDDEPGRPPVMVLSYRAWSQHFDSDPGIVGRTLRVNGTQFEIVGVMPEGFRGLEVIAAPDFWSPYALAELFREEGPVEGSPFGNVNIVGRLNPGVSQGQALARLTAWDAAREAERGAVAAGDRPAASLVLAPSQGTMPQPAQALLAFTPIFFAFGLILLIGCANVANLLLARLVARQREIGIRLSMGASRARVVWQLLIESLLLALISAALAFGIARVVLEGAVYALTTSFPPEIGNMRVAVPPGDWRVALFLVGGAFFSTVLFALAPALKATRVDLVRAIRGEALGVGGRPARPRNVLIALQVTGSVLLLVCAAIFLRSAWSASTLESGIRTADVVNVSVLSEARRGAILEAVRNEPAVATVAAAWPAFLGGVGGAPAYAEGPAGRSISSYSFVTREYFDVLGLELVRGRGFADSERDPNASVAIVSESVAASLWPGGDALGQVVRVEPDASLLPGGGSSAASAQQLSDDPMTRPRTAVVIGVTRDVAGLRMGGFRIGDTGVYMPIAHEAAGTALLARVRGDAETARRAVIDRIAAVDPNIAEVGSLATIASAETYILGLSFWLTMGLGGLALLLTLSGLFGVLSYLVEQRTREIGVRIALGASAGSVGALVVRQSARPVVIGLVIGAALAAGLGGLLLSSPAAEQIGSTVLLFDPLAYLGSMLFVIAACAAAALAPALRAGRVNPLVALRQD